MKRDVIEMSNKIEELYRGLFPIPVEILRLPVTLGGMGLLSVDDIRQISRVSYLVEIGQREVPNSIRGYIPEGKEKEKQWQNEITKAYYRRQREIYVMSLKETKADKNIVQMLDDRQTGSAHSLLTSPPSNHTQAMDDIAFRLCIALRYHVDILDKSGVKCTRCNADTTLWHSLRCRLEHAKNNIWIHNKVKLIVGETIKRHKNVVNVRYEQMGREDIGVNTHIPDIVVSFIDGREQALDITIENKYANSTGRYEPGKGITLKVNQYKNSRSDAHVIALDNSGRINTESWNFLKGLGMKRGILKYIQVLIMKHNAKALMDLSEKCIEQNAKDLRHIGNGMQVAAEGL